jgi:phosphoglycolate phosphatase-like HAD superfamily hydrolase
MTIPISASRRRDDCVVLEGTTDSTTSISATVSIDWKNLKAVIFDIDGTLADSWKLGYDATLQVLAKNNLPSVSVETYHDCTRYATPDRLARHAGLEPGHPNYTSLGNELATEFDNLYVGLVDTVTAGFYPGMDDLLQRIPSSLALGALTNACVDYAHAVLKANSNVFVANEAKKSSAGDYTARFRSVRGADNVPKPKPFPDGLLQVCQDLSVDPSHCIYIGDSPSDAMAAHAAGMPSIGVLWGSHSETSLQGAPFSILCRSVKELETLFAENNLLLD